jgi:hypothetical protein
MNERTDAERNRDVTPDVDPDGSMSGVGVPSDRHAIEGLGYTGDGDPKPGTDADVGTNEVGGTEDRPAG